MHRWVDHTSELELHISADNAGDVFAEATSALGEILGDATGDSSTRALSVDARDRAGLLAAWLEELVFTAEQEGLIPTGASVSLEPGRAAGDVDFRAGTPSHLVKAVTYHRLSFEQVGGEWTATVVLDV